MLKNNMIVFKNGQIISMFEVYNGGGTFIAVSGHMSGEHSLVTKRKAEVSHLITFIQHCPGAHNL